MLVDLLKKYKFEFLLLVITFNLISIAGALLNIGHLSRNKSICAKFQAGELTLEGIKKAKKIIGLKKWQLDYYCNQIK